MEENTDREALIQAGRERFRRVLELLATEGREPPADAQSAVVRLLADALHYDESVKVTAAANEAQKLYWQESGKKPRVELLQVQSNVW